jgi:hypothetical protein
VNPATRYSENRPRPKRVRCLVTGRVGDVHAWSYANEPWHGGGIPLVMLDGKIDGYWYWTEPEEVRT